MVNEGFLDFFKKSHPPKVETPTPVATKPSEPKVDTPKKNVYADQFVKIFDKLNEMATKNGFKESKRYIEQESGLDSFVNYVVFEKGSRKIDIKYSWNKSLVVGKFNITVQDNGVEEYKTAKEVSQKEIPTVVGELFSTKISVPREKEDFKETTRIEELKKIADENGWNAKGVSDNSYVFTKKGFVPFLFTLKHSINGEVNSTIEIGKKGSASFSPLDAYDLISHLLKTGEVLNKFLINSNLSKDDKTDSNDVEIDYSDPTLTREKERRLRAKPSQKPTTQPQETPSTQKQVSDSTIQKRIRKYRTELVDTIKQADDWDIKNSPKGVSFTRDNENIIFNPKLKNSKNEFEYVIYKNNRRMKFNSADELYKTVFKLLLSQPK